MTGKMTKKERVLSAIAYKETDRTPVFDILLHDGLIEHVTGSIPSIGKSGIKLKCETISRALDMTRMAEFGPVEPGVRTDTHGFVHDHDRWIYLGIKKRPFNDEKGAVSWIRQEITRLGKEKIDIDLVRKKYLDNNSMIRSYLGDDTVVLFRESGTGLDTIRHQLGLELFSYTCMDEPSLISEYLELSTNREIQIVNAIADLELSPCALTYGDIAYKHGLLHSPDWLRKQFLPRLKKLNDTWHSYGIKCLFHSDGNLNQIIDELIDTGIDGLNPIETVAGMSVSGLYKKYHKRIFLTGGIDMSQLLSKGSYDEVYEECKAAIKNAPCGYFIGSTTELDNSAKTDNILAMLRAAGVDI